jgi:uncharacterized repeat protein (TIGR04076 family)
MKKIRITILKTTINNEYAGEYCSEVVTKCPIFKEGAVFVIDKFEKPEGFCVWAWQDLFYMIHTLWNGGSFDPWYKQKGVVIGCCTDGIRPVFFRIERI